MTSTRNPGRFAGLLYLLMGLPAPFALIYLPHILMVRGNATATASNIVASDLLVRLGVAAQLLSQTLFIFVVLALYDLLKGVDRKRASLMVTLVLVSVPIAFLNELNSIASLLLARGPAYLSSIGKPQRDALAMLFLDLHGRGIDIVAIFWGLWLIPLGLLVYRSAFIPRILGILLIINGIAYPVGTLTHLLLPHYNEIVSRVMILPQLGELWFILWLLVKGAVPREGEGMSSGPSTPRSTG
ncbi:MAG: hypothetical protein JWO56_2061 [Acidobacteria bacterium]|nr:hypothetical protein [Acidobacteriota bacterium]